jgi:hypothetical protein
VERVLQLSREKTIVEQNYVQEKGKLDQTRCEVKVQVGDDDSA